LANSAVSLVKKVLLSGLFVGSLEPCIESSIIFSAAGFLHASNVLFFLWIGAIELWGVGQFLLLLTNFEKGERLRSGILLWFMLSPAVFVFFVVGSLLAPYIRLLNMWGPLTVCLVAALVAGIPARIPRTRIPLAYVSLLAGVFSDIIISLSSPRSSPLISFQSDVILSTFYIDAFLGITVLATSFLADRIKLRRNGVANNRLRAATFFYLVATAGFLAGIFPPFVPVLVLALSFLSFTLVSVSRMRHQSSKKSQASFS